MIYVYSIASTQKFISRQLYRTLTSKGSKDREKLAWAAAEISPRVKINGLLETLIGRLIRSATVLSDGNLGFGNTQANIFNDLTSISALTGNQFPKTAALVGFVINHLQTRGDKPLSPSTIITEMAKASELVEYYIEVIGADGFVKSKKLSNCSNSVRPLFEAMLRDRDALITGMDACAAELTTSFVHEQILNQDEEILINLPWTTERLISEIYGLDGCDLYVSFYAKRELESIAIDVRNRYYGGNLIMHSEGSSLYIERISPGWTGYLEREQESCDPSAIPLSREELRLLTQSQESLNRLLINRPDMKSVIEKQPQVSRKDTDDRKVIIIYPDKREDRAAIHRYLINLENSEEIQRTTVV